MSNPVKVSDLSNLVTAFNNDDIFYVVHNGQSGRTAWQYIIAQLGTNPTLLWNPETQTITISGGNSISLGPFELAVTGSEVTFTLRAGKLLDTIVFIPNGAQNVKVGTSTGASDIFNEDVDDAIPIELSRNIYAKVDQVFYINATDCAVKIYLR